MWTISDALPHEDARAPSPSACQVPVQSRDAHLSYCDFIDSSLEGAKLHHGSRRGMVRTLPNFPWKPLRNRGTHHLSYTVLSEFKKYCFVSKLRPKMLRNREKIESKFRGFFAPAKIRGGLGEILAVRYRVRPRS